MNRVCRRLAVFLIVVANCTGCASGKATSTLEPLDSGRPSRPNLTRAQVQEDFDQLKTIIGTQPKAFTDPAVLEAAFVSQQALLRDGMSEAELYRLLSPVVAAIRCGHSSLKYSVAYEKDVELNGKFLPLLVNVLDDRLYVNRSLSDVLPPGSEITAIGGKPAAEILGILFSSLTSDGTNFSGKYYVLNHWFSEMYFNYVENSPSYRVSFLRPGGEESETVDLEGASATALRTAERKRDVQTSSLGSPYSMRFEDGYAVLRVTSFGFYAAKDRSAFTAFLDDAFTQLTQSGTKNLVLDLRGNWGGDPLSSSYLFSYLLRERAPYFVTGTPFYTQLTKPIEPADHRFLGALYVLTNGASFSTTGHLCSLLRFHKLGIFVGQETGGTFVCTDSSQDAVLTNSGLRLHYSTKTFAAAVSGFTAGRGIEPDFPIVPTLSDLLDGRDVELAAAVDMIRR